MLCEFCKGQRKNSNATRLIVAPESPEIHGKYVCDACWDWAKDTFKMLVDYIEYKDGFK